MYKSEALCLVFVCLDVVQRGEASIRVFTNYYASLESHSGRERVIIRRCQHLTPFECRSIREVGKGSYRW